MDAIRARERARRALLPERSRWDSGLRSGTPEGIEADVSNQFVIPGASFEITLAGIMGFDALPDS